MMARPSRRATRAPISEVPTAVCVASRYAQATDDRSTCSPSAPCRSPSCTPFCAAGGSRGWLVTNSPYSRKTTPEGAAGTRSSRGPRLANRTCSPCDQLHPTRAPLRETELADKLARHSGDYKMALDSVRIACANVESDLATILAETMVLPAQAKKVLANIFRGRPVRHYRPTCPGRQPHRARRNCQLVRPLQPAEAHPAGRPRHAPTPLSGPKCLRRPARTLGLAR